jgi:hypothetical protein
LAPTPDGEPTPAQRRKMALISERKPKGSIEDSGYFRVTGDKDMAALMQKVQSAVIANGYELESLIYEEVPESFYEKRQNVNETGIKNIQKDTFMHKVKIKNNLNKGIDLDFAIFTNNKIYIVETKDGSNFDTKKASGEVDSLQKAKKIVHTADHGQRGVECMIVLWNEEDVSKASFKDKRAQKMLISGRDFCTKFKINFASIQNRRKEDTETNRQYVQEQMKKITKENNNETII